MDTSPLVRFALRLAADRFATDPYLRDHYAENLPPALGNLSPDEIVHLLKETEVSSIDQQTVYGQSAF